MDELWILKSRSSLGKHSSLVERLNPLLYFITEFWLPHDLLLWSYSRTPLQTSRIQNGKAEFQVKMGHRNLGLPVMQPRWQPQSWLGPPAPRRSAWGHWKDSLNRADKWDHCLWGKEQMYRNELRVRVDIRHQSSTFKAGTAAAREPISGEFRPQAWSWSCPHSICEVLGKRFQLSEPQSPPSRHGLITPMTS